CERQACRRRPRVSRGRTLTSSNILQNAPISSNRYEQSSKRAVTTTKRGSLSTIVPKSPKPFLAGLEKTPTTPMVRIRLGRCQIPNGGGRSYRKRFKRRED